jgi:hypothetical protein
MKSISILKECINLAKIELSIVNRQFLDRQLPVKELLASKVKDGKLNAMLKL